LAAKGQRRAQHEVYTLTTARQVTLSGVRHVMLTLFPTWKSRRRWDDNIKVYIQEMGWGSMEWIDLAKERDRWEAVMNEVMNLQFT